MCAAWEVGAASAAADLLLVVLLADLQQPARECPAWWCNRSGSNSRTRTDSPFAFLSGLFCCVAQWIQKPLKETGLEMCATRTGCDTCRVRRTLAPLKPSHFDSYLEHMVHAACLHYYVFSLYLSTCADIQHGERTSMHAHHVREASTAVPDRIAAHTHCTQQGPPAVGGVKLKRICQQAVDQACTQVPARRNAEQTEQCGERL